MAEPYELLIECSVDIEAPPAQVWDVIGDVRRMPELSPYVLSTRLRAGFEQLAVGTEFTNLNRMGELEWKTHGEVVRYTPGVEIAFRIAENRAIWSFTLEAVVPGATRLTQRREIPDGLSQFSLDLTDTYLGGQAAFTQALREGMQATLDRVRAVAEGSVAGEAAHA